MRSRTTWKRGLEAGLWGVILFRLTGMGRLVPVGGTIPWTWIPNNRRQRV